jgi:hypothetical protein
MSALPCVVCANRLPGEYDGLPRCGVTSSRLLAVASWRNMRRDLGESYVRPCPGYDPGDVLGAPEADPISDLRRAVVALAATVEDVARQRDDLARRLADSDADRVRLIRELMALRLDVSRG